MICFVGCMEMTRPLAAVFKNAFASNGVPRFLGLLLPLLIPGSSQIGRRSPLRSRTWKNRPPSSITLPQAELHAQRGSPVRSSPGPLYQAAWTAVSTAMGADGVACAGTKYKGEGVARSGRFSDRPPPRQDQNDRGRGI